jgi:hypothetical protein
MQQAGLLHAPTVSCTERRIAGTEHWTQHATKKCFFFFMYWAEFCVHQQGVRTRNDNDFGICTSNGEISGLARHQKDSIIQCNAHDFILRNRVSAACKGVHSDCIFPKKGFQHEMITGTTLDTAKTFI